MFRTHGVFIWNTNRDGQVVIIFFVRIYSRTAQSDLKFRILFWNCWLAAT